MPSTAFIHLLQVDAAWFNTAALLFTDSYWVVIPFAAGVFHSQHSSGKGWKRLLPGLVLIGAVLAAVSTSSVLKQVFDAARPCVLDPGVGIGGCETDPSFPSNHAAAVFAMLPFFTGQRKWLTIFGVYAVLVAVSRVYLGQHWPTDVFVGAALGYGVGYGVTRVAKHRGVY